MQRERELAANTEVTVAEVGRAETKKNEKGKGREASRQRKKNLDTFSFFLSGQAKLFRSASLWSARFFVPNRCFRPGAGEILVSALGSARS